MKKKVYPFGILLSLLFMVDVFVSISDYGGEQNVLYRNGLLFVGQLVTVICGFYAIRMYGMRSVTGRTLAFFTTGFLSFLVGAAIFSYYDATREISPFPSLADGFILFGYPLFFTGLLLELRKKTISLGKGLQLLFVLFALLLSVVVFYFEIYIPYDMTSSFFVTAVQTAYGVADLILIILFIFVLLLALSYKGGKMFYVWFCFFVGFILTLFGDILFGVYVNDYLAKTGINIYIDLIWRSAYVFFAFGLLLAGMLVASVQSNILQKIAKK
ncbi:MAG: hypothetical protein Q8Q49_03690 [bacterium]|nr:hypothetical protein [bacterium]